SDRTRSAPPWQTPEAARSSRAAALRGNLAGAYFRRARACGKLVEHAIDVAVSVSTPVSLRELDRFVDGDAIGYFGRTQNLECADHEDGLLDRRYLRRGSIQIRRECANQCLELSHHAAPQRIEERAI